MSVEVSTHPILRGAGESRARLRAMDWAATPMGEPPTWPAELLTAVDLMLNARYAAAVMWGKGHHMLYNDAYALVLGRRHPAALAQPFAEVWPELWELLRPSIEGAMAGVPAYFDNHPLTITPDGAPQQRWFTSSYSPVRDAQGSVLGLFNADFETTRRVADEARLAFQLALADRLRPLSAASDIVATASEMLGEHLGVGRVVYVEIDPGQKQFFVRRQWAQSGMVDISGEPRALNDFGPQIIRQLQSGHPMVVHDVRTDPHTADHADSYAAIGVRGNLAVPLVKAGRLTVVLSLHTAQPRQWTDTEVQLVRDVAERTWLAVEAVRAETELDETQAWLNAMFDTLPVGVGVFDASGTLKLANHAMGRYLPTGVLPSHDAQRSSRWHIETPDGTPRAPHEFPGARASRGERVVPGVEALFTPDDGVALWTEVAAVPIRNAAGEVTGQVSVVHDIDALKRSEAQLRRMADDLSESNRRQSEFLAVLAHELRNPLAPILTGLELMRLRPDHAPTAARVREILERQTRQMVHLIDDLLDIARVTRGKIEIRREPMDLRTAVTTAVETSQPLIEQAGHAFSVQMHDAPLPLLADATRLSQIVSNLLTNAAKYTPSGGNIRLVVFPDGGDAVVTVTDDGLGIPAPSLASIFDMFSQVERQADSSPGGLGIGLALVRQLVSLHGGTVAAESAGPGQGSSFTVRLPLASQAAPAAAEAPSAAASAPRVLRVLVADDNVDAALSLAALLDLYGHDAQVAHDGPEALRLAAGQLHDVMFLDIGMPGMSGYELARRLRTLPAFEHTMLVAVTGWGTQDDQDRARDAGFDLHLTKPVSPEAITRLLGSLL